MLRTRQLACLLLLFSAFGAVAAAAPVRLSHTHIQALLARGAETTAGDPAPLAPEPQNPGDRTATALPSAPRDLFRSTPAAYPPAAQAASVHTATGLSRA